MSDAGGQLTAFEDSHVSLVASLGLLGFRQRLLSALQTLAPEVAQRESGQATVPPLLPEDDPFVLAVLGAIGFLEGAEATLQQVSPRAGEQESVRNEFAGVPRDVRR